MNNIKECFNEIRKITFVYFICISIFEPRHITDTFYYTAKGLKSYYTNKITVIYFTKAYGEPRL